MPIAVRKAEPSDIATLAAALAAAFQDDPMMSWLLPGERGRARRLRTLYSLMLKHQHLPHGEVYMSPSRSGGALWAPPDKWQTPPAKSLRALPRLSVALGVRLPAAVRAVVAMEKAHPTQSHWYLAVLGIEPSGQRMGIGSALLAPVLQRCDRDGTHAYLESSKESNLAFYSRHGFEVTSAVDLPDGGPRVWPMWREPRP